MHFETTLPEGVFQGELVFYSGFLPFGLKARTDIVSLPTELPRVGDPIVCYEWFEAGIVIPSEPLILAGSTFYRPATGIKRETEARVVVASPGRGTELWLQTADTRPERLKNIGNPDGFSVFALPPIDREYRLIVLGPKTGPVRALRTQGSGFGQENAAALEFKQEGNPNYINLETLETTPTNRETWLSINGSAYLASENGGFPWVPLNWGSTANLRFEFAGPGNSWQYAKGSMARSQIFQEIRVKPKYLVAGTRKVNGPSEKSQIPGLSGRRRGS